MAWKKEYPKQIVCMPGNEAETIEYACKKFVDLSERVLQTKATFSVALAGGSTPRSFYRAIAHPPYCEKIAWDRLLLFWGDERERPLNHPESNHYLAIIEGELGTLPLRKEHIFPMHVGGNPVQQAEEYTSILRDKLGDSLFDLVLLGVGEDGHTASLFPGTEVLCEREKWVKAHFVPAKKMWRMTLTFPCIAKSQRAVFLALGKKKAPIVSKILENPSIALPASQIGSSEKKALWIVDNNAAMLL
ncbi:MAG: 6-phosphogluconolactonase [Chlamydiota bacterium]